MQLPFSGSATARSDPCLLRLHCSRGDLQVGIAADRTPSADRERFSKRICISARVSRFRIYTEMRLEIRFSWQERTLTPRITSKNYRIYLRYVFDDAIFANEQRLGISEDFVIVIEKVIRKLKNLLFTDNSGSNTCTKYIYAEI